MSGTCAAHAPGPARPGRPGRDQILLAAPRGRLLCYARAHQTAGVLAEVLVTFGQLGTQYADALWAEVWGRTFAMCGDCWQMTCTVVTARRPRTVIRDTRPAPAPGQAQGR